jgi:glycosyltransferase involved in cell wall biosynthesis
MQPNISVIIPVYNSGEYLPKCLDSLVNQTLRDIEIICVDDGSTDSSPEILTKYALKHPRIKVITQPNQKQGAARNNGMAIATGEFIGFADSDDWVELDYYEKLYNAAKEHGADIAATNIVLEGHPKKQFKPWFEKTEELLSAADKFNAALNGNQWGVVTKIYRRDKLVEHNVKFAEGIYFEDVSFTVRALYYLGKMVGIPGAAYHYRYVKNSSSHEKSKEKARNLAAANFDLAQFADEKGLDFIDVTIRKDRLGLPGVPLVTIKHHLKHRDYHLFGVKVFSRKVNYLPS